MQSRQRWVLGLTAAGVVTTAALLLPRSVPAPLSVPVRRAVPTVPRVRTFSSPKGTGVLDTQRPLRDDVHVAKDAVDPTPNPIEAGRGPGPEAGLREALSRQLARKQSTWQARLPEACRRKEFLDWYHSVSVRVDASIVDSAVLTWRGEQSQEYQQEYELGLNA